MRSSAMCHPFLWSDPVGMSARRVEKWWPGKSIYQIPMLHTTRLQADMVDAGPSRPQSANPFSSSQPNQIHLMTADLDRPLSVSTM